MEQSSITLKYTTRVDTRMKPITKEEFSRRRKQVQEEIEEMGFVVKMNEYVNPERWI